MVVAAAAAVLEEAAVEEVPAVGVVVAMEEVGHLA